MSPEQIRALNMACLAEHTLKSLGVNADKPDAETILEHSIAQACIELEAVESILEHEQNSKNDEILRLLYVITGIRERLELARECNETLAEIMAEGSEHDLIVKAGEAAE